MNRDIRSPEDAFIALVDEVPPLFFRLRALAEYVHAERGMSAGQRAVLRDVVEEGPLTAPDLAAMRSVTRQAVQPVIDELSERGLVETRENPRHKRSSLVFATERGVQTHAFMRDQERAGLELVAREFTLGELTAALQAVRHVSKVLKLHFPDDQG